MNQDPTQSPEQLATPDESRVNGLVFLVERALSDLSPSVWDTRGIDVIQVEAERWKVTATMQEIYLAHARVIERERLGNTRNWIIYKKSGGKHTGLDKNNQPLPTDIDNEELLEETEYKSSQNQDFVTGGTMSGDQIMLHTAYGKVSTTVEHILSFRLFQQDVLRYTKLIYPARYKKLHEKNVTKWLDKVSFSSDDAADDSLPINLFTQLFPTFIELAETEEPRFERALRQKQHAVRRGNEILFTMATLLEWLRKADPDHRFRRGELKTFLRELYGTRYSESGRAYNLRLHSVHLAPGDECYMEPSPEPPSPPETMAPENTGTGTDNPEEVQHDSGSGENNPTHHGHNEPDPAGLPPSEHAHHVVLADDSPRSEGTPESEAEPF